MSKTVQINSPSQFSNLLSSSTVVVVDFYADWCGPCKTISPLYEQLSSRLSRPNRITFTKCNVDTQQQIARSYNVSAMPTFLVFKSGREVNRVQGVDPPKLNQAIQRVAQEADAVGDGEVGSSGGSEIGGKWIAKEPPRGYTDVTDQVDVRGLDVLNADSEFGNARTLFDTSRPSSLAAGGKGKGKAEGAAGGKKDWMESDTDEQLMLYIPFQSTVKIHSLQITSLPAESADSDEVPMRPAQLKLYTNRAHNLGFEEADDMAATQDVEIKGEDWDEQTGTARVELRFVKFQNVSSLVVFIAKGDGDGERTRVDRIRVVGETGQKRDMGKLEKVGHESGE